MIEVARALRLGKNRGSAASELAPTVSLNLYERVLLSDWLCQHHLQTGLDDFAHIPAFQVIVLFIEVSKLLLQLVDIVGRGNFVADHSFQQVSYSLTG